MKTIIAYKLVGALFLMTAAGAQADHHCANLPGMLLRIDTYHIDLNDKRPICVTVPGEFKIKIIAPNGMIEADQVTVAHKDPANPPPVTIVGSNEDSADELVVKVEGDPGNEEFFEFWIKIENVGKLDPRIRVIPSAELDALLRTYFEDGLDAYGLPIEYSEKVLLLNSD